MCLNTEMPMHTGFCVVFPCNASDLYFHLIWVYSLIFSVSISEFQSLYFLCAVPMIVFFFFFFLWWFHFCSLPHELFQLLYFCVHACVHTCVCMYMYIHVCEDLMTKYWEVSECPGWLFLLDKCLLNSIHFLVPFLCCFYNSAHTFSGSFLMTPVLRKVNFGYARYL